MIFTTRRLVLRELLATDAPFVRALMNEPSFIAQIGDRGVHTVEDAQRYIEAARGTWSTLAFGLWLVQLRDTEEPIGICGLLQRDTLRSPDVGFAFLSRFRANGYAFESACAVMSFATNVLHLPEVLAVVNPSNTASIRLLEKLGFELAREAQGLNHGRGVPSMSRHCRGLMRMSASDWLHPSDTWEATPGGARGGGDRRSGFAAGHPAWPSRSHNSGLAAARELHGLTTRCISRWPVATLLSSRPCAGLRSCGPARSARGVDDAAGQVAAHRRRDFRNKRPSTAGRVSRHSGRRVRRRRARTGRERSELRWPCRGGWSAPSAPRCRRIFGILRWRAPRSAAQIAGREHRVAAVRSSHWVPGAISNGPISSVTSTVVMLKASEFSGARPGSRRRLEVAVPGLVQRAGAGHVEARPRRCGIRVRGRLRQTATTHGCPAMSTKPDEALRWTST